MASISFAKILTTFNDKVKGCSLFNAKTRNHNKAGTAVASCQNQPVAVICEQVAI